MYRTDVEQGPTSETCNLEGWDTSFEYQDNSIKNIILVCIETVYLLFTPLFSEGAVSMYVNANHYHLNTAYYDSGQVENLVTVLGAKQCQKAVSAHLKSKQIPPFGFARQYCCNSLTTTRRSNASSPLNTWKFHDDV